MFLRSLQHALTVDPGFDARGVVVAAFDLQSLGYSEARNRAFYAELTERIARLPDVGGVTLARNVPLAGGGGRNLAVVEAYEPQPGEDMEFHSNLVGPEYFEVLRVPLVRGRGFDATDREGAPQVAVVNEAFAERFWPGQDPIGKRLSSFSLVPSIEVVGVARDGKYLTLTEPPRPYVYRPYLQEYEDMTLHVRVGGDVAAVIPSIRREIRAVDDRVPILTLASMQEPDGICDVAAAYCRRAARWLRFARVAARGRRAVWRRRLRGQPAHARDRHPHGARCRARCRSAHDFAEQSEGRGLGPCDRLGAFARGWPLGGVLSRWRERGGPGCATRRAARPDRVHARRELAAGASRGSDRSDAGSTRGIEANEIFTRGMNGWKPCSTTSGTRGACSARTSCSLRRPLPR